MKNYGRCSIYDFLEDLVVFRNLTPLDARLPDLEAVRRKKGLPDDLIPRKSSPAYADVISSILIRARALEMPHATIQHLIYLGDTRMNDGTAFTNICRAGGWRGLAFIATERKDPNPAEIVEQKDGILYLADHWGDIFAFDEFLQNRDFPIDESTTVIIDLDKTVLGARGRNDHVIDRARVEAVRRTVDELLGDSYDLLQFQAAYDCLNQSEYHTFTTDNQDYLAYTCLILSAGLMDLDALTDGLEADPGKTFPQFMLEVEDRAPELPGQLRNLHDEVFGYLQEGDPTPFKTFRHNEYLTTIERMGCLADNASVSQMLHEEIVITQEVREIVLSWREKGALLFGLSDKPDEASIPADFLKAKGYRAIHHVDTHAIGG
jgi:hypothetical protein